MVKHNDGAIDRLAGLEEKLVEFIVRLDQVKVEVADIKAQQADLINLIRKQYKK